MEREHLGDGESRVEPKSAGSWGCAVSFFAGLLGIVVALRWSATLGISLFVIAAVLGWRRAKRSAALAEARRARRVAGHGSLVGDVWRRLFAAEGLGDIVDRLAPHVRPAVRVSTTRADVLAPGASRIGGIPDLAPGITWPRHDGRPLAFLAQFDLREVAQVEPRSPLPRTGHLWFFCDPTEYSCVPATVLYASSAVALVLTEPPADLPKKSRFPSCVVTLETYEDIPDPANEPWLNAWLDEADADARAEAYYEIQSQLESGLHKDPHKLLGYAGSIQGAMELGCECVSKGIPFPPPKKDADRVKELENSAREWRLLFQVESDGNAGMMWGDAGRLYFWIRDEDLRAARFDRAWFDFQCH